MLPSDFSFWQYKAFADIRGVYNALSSLSPSLVAWPKESAPNRWSEVVVRVAKLTTKTRVVYSE